MALVVKNPPANAGDIRHTSSIPGSGRSPGGGHGNLLQYSCLENPMDKGAWWDSPQGHKESDVTEATYQFRGSVVPNSLQPHALQHARLPCPSPAPRACSNSCPSSRWCHPTISSSIFPFSSHLQSFPASGSFPMSQFFASGSQRIGVSASASILPINIQDWFPLGLTAWISLQGTLKSSPRPWFKTINSSALSFLYSPTLTSIHDYWKNHSFN